MYLTWIHAFKIKLLQLKTLLVIVGDRTHGEKPIALHL